MGDGVGDHAAGDPVDLGSQLEALERLRAARPGEVDAFLTQIGLDAGSTSSTIVEQLADGRVIARPELFARAHRRTVRAVEVLYRNGRIPAPIRGWGPLRPLAQLVQVFVTSFVTRAYVKSLLESVLELYLSREAQADRRSEEWRLVTLARRSPERLDARYRVDRFGIPAFVAGGTLVAAGVGALNAILRRIFDYDSLIVVFAGLSCVLLLVVGRAILQGAGVARRRIALTAEPAARNLFEVVGGSGTPPSDHSRMVALGAVVTLLLLWVVIPVILLGAFLN